MHTHSQTDGYYRQTLAPLPLIAISAYSGVGADNNALRSKPFQTWRTRLELNQVAARFDTSAAIASIEATEANESAVFHSSW